MEIILFHSGLDLPVYLPYTFKQIRLFNPDINVHFLTDTAYISDPVFGKYNIKVYNRNAYFSSDVSKFILHFKYHNKSKDLQFWVVTATRLIYIQNFMRTHNLKEVYHFENDILIYYDLKTLHDTFRKLYCTLAITPGGPDKCMTGLLYVPHYLSLLLMTQFFIKQLKEVGKKRLKQIYGMDMVNEMTLMRAFSKEFPDLLQFLPILPFGEFSENFLEFNSIFDPASWGQFVGGNAQEKKPGLKPKDHYIGKILEDNPDYTVVWEKDELNRNIPFFTFNGSKVKINNLHIHCKELYRYVS